MAANILLETGPDILLAENGDTLRREEAFFATLTGSAMAGFTEAGAEAGGETIIITLTEGAQWLPE